VRAHVNAQEDLRVIDASSLDERALAKLIVASTQADHFHQAPRILHRFLAAASSLQTGSLNPNPA
jgi:hypothetical protein